MQTDHIEHRDDRGRTAYYLYTQAEADKKGVKYTSDWRNAEVGDYIITDGDSEPAVLMILAKKASIIRHVRGTFSTINSKKISSEKRINRYTLGGR